MKTNKYLDKVFKVMDERDKEKKKEATQEQSKEKKYCKSFEKSSNGFCKHYMGCKVNIVSCAMECAMGYPGGERYENKPDT